MSMCICMYVCVLCNYFCDRINIESMSLSVLSHVIVQHTFCHLVGAHYSLNVSRINGAGNGFFSIVQ